MPQEPPAKHQPDHYRRGEPGGQADQHPRPRAHPAPPAAHPGHWPCPLSITRPAVPIRYGRTPLPGPVTFTRSHRGRYHTDWLAAARPMSFGRAGSPRAADPGGDRSRHRRLPQPRPARGHGPPPGTITDRRPRFVTPQARASAGTTPTGIPAPLRSTPPCVPARAHARPARGTVARHPRESDQARSPLMPVGVPLRVAPPIRPLHPHDTIRTRVRFARARRQRPKAGHPSAWSRSPKFGTQPTSGPARVDRAPHRHYLRHRRRRFRFVAGQPLPQGPPGVA